MNIVDYISTQNNEYLKLIKRGEKKAKDLDDELEALCYELEEAEQKYNVKRRETAVAYDTRISRLEAMFDKDKKDVDLKVNAIKNELDSQKKKHIDDVNSRLKKIDDDHKDEIGRIKAQYSEKILKLEEEFELRIAGLDHSKKIFEEQQIAEKDRKSQELISAVQKKENERAILKSKIDNCIAEYTDKFITAVYNGRSCEDIKEKYTIISYAEQYYDVCNQISDFQKNANILSNKNIVVGNVDDSDVKYWRDIYLDEKQSLESLRDRKLKKAEAKYLEEKAELERNLGDVSGYDIKKNRDITDFYNDIEQKKNALP